MSVFGSKITIFHCFSPKNHCLAQFGQDLSGDPDGDDLWPSGLLMAATPPPSFRPLFMLFYSIEVLHIHITCLHVYIVYIYLHLFA